MFKLVAQLAIDSINLQLPIGGTQDLDIHSQWTYSEILSVPETNGKVNLD